MESNSCVVFRIGRLWVGLSWSRAMHKRNRHMMSSLAFLICRHQNPLDHNINLQVAQFIRRWFHCSFFCFFPTKVNISQEVNHIWFASERHQQSKAQWKGTMLPFYVNLDSVVLPFRSSRQLNRNTSIKSELSIILYFFYFYSDSHVRRTALELALNWNQWLGICCLATFNTFAIYNKE